MNEMQTAEIGSIKQVSDTDLLRAIFNLCRLEYQVWDAAERRTPGMTPEVRELFSLDALQPLIDVARCRAEAGSAECAQFLDAADRIASAPPRPALVKGEESHAYANHFFPTGVRDAARKDDFAVIHQYRIGMDERRLISIARAASPRATT